MIRFFRKLFGFEPEPIRSVANHQTIRVADGRAFRERLAQNARRIDEDRRRERDRMREDARKDRFERSSSDDTLANPLHPLNPLNPAYHSSSPAYSSSSDSSCSPSSYDSGSSSSYDSGGSCGGGSD